LSNYPSYVQILSSCLRSRAARSQLDPAPWGPRALDPPCAKKDNAGGSIHCHRTPESIPSPAAHQKNTAGKKTPGAGTTIGPKFRNPAIALILYIGVGEKKPSRLGFGAFLTRKTQAEWRGSAGALLNISPPLPQPPLPQHVPRDLFLAGAFLMCLLWLCEKGRGIKEHHTQNTTREGAATATKHPGQYQISHTTKTHTHTKNTAFWAHSLCTRAQCRTRAPGSEAPLRPSQRADAMRPCRV
jgi:hypothetical protein